MNEVREAAGLAAFGNATANGQVLPEPSVRTNTIVAATLWNEICVEITGMFRLFPVPIILVSVFYGHEAVSAAVTGTAGSDGTEAQELEGTFAYHPNGKDCKAAVQYWKDGFSLFNNELPPTYTEPENPAVYTEKAISFVALYNPQPKPVASCALVTCTQGGAFAAPRMLKSHEGLSTRRLQGEEDSTTAVICLTNPVALSNGQKPFEEEVWQKIVQAIVGTEESNGVSPVRPSLAVGFIMMLFAYALF
ncbi:LOW QUALITY PROTEIN: SAG family member [Eimeria necatrix]|uniref:SAG family member n=1 Tax=Eimeria necatrix TaxID=51315 RepID=U6MKA8_9EIME|nr:LOW QUALITY PROTEIN: SAG family member [Eimeria necatrix]CDJ62904.1 SAG family member [Eimeria necatrix]